MKKKKNQIDQILDPLDDSNIILYNENDEPHEFEQIAAIPIVGKGLFVILRQVDDPSLKEDEAHVYEIRKNSDGEQMLCFVDDEEIIDRVTDIYLRLLNDAK